MSKKQPIKPGDRVELSENFGELKAGRRGIVVLTKDRPPYIKEPGPVLAVHFDEAIGPAVTREVNGEHQLVIDKCKKVTKE